MKRNFYQDNLNYYDEIIIQDSLNFRSYLIKVYNYMAAGLTLTGSMAFIVTLNPRIAETILTTPLAWVVIFVPIGLVYYLSRRIYTLTPTTAQALFWIYAATMGLSLSSIFIAYTGISIAKTFLITASTFAATSIYGYVTYRDLTRLDAFLFMGLIGLLLCGIINLFLQSSLADTIRSVIGVILFIVLTAVDVQRIKKIYTHTETTESATKKAILGALALYLDYLNLFLYLLHFLGQRRKNHSERS
jgi:FtsH-binding integral membrane protein